MLPVVAVMGASKVIKGVFGNQHPEDPDRFNKNALAFRLAQGGNREAYKFLMGMSGKYGSIEIAPIPGLTDGGAASGWATDATRSDAYSKVKALQPLFDAQLNFTGHQSPDEIVAQRELNQVTPAVAGGWGFGLIVVALLLGALAMGGKRAPAAA